MNLGDEQAGRYSHMKPDLCGAGRSLVSVSHICGTLFVCLEICVSIC
jgi:hypothetical protein